jgi:enoyl-CoA hydratase/carnithine racemase
VSASFVQSAIDGGVATLTLSRPEKLNALTRAGLEELLDALQQAERDPGVRAVVLRGAGRSFCAGADVVEVMADADVDAAGRFLTRLADVLRSVSLLAKPVVAALQGHAAGGGAELALECDLRIAAPDAQLWFPDVGIGSTPASLYMLYRCVGRAKATEMAMLGTRLGADEMLRSGLVTEVVPSGDLEEAAGALARRLVALSPTSLRLAKHAVRLADEASREIDLAANVTSMLTCWQSPEQHEAAAGFRTRSAEADAPGAALSDGSPADASPSQ